jgi:hypothetical protein
MQFSNASGAQASCDVGEHRHNLVQPVAFDRPEHL